MVEVQERDLIGHCSAMACDMSIRLIPDAMTDPADIERLRAGLEQALQVFTDVDRTCTRFDPHSPLMQANARPGQWTEVAPECFAALIEAFRAYRETEGRFDPRVLSDLVRLGYAGSTTRQPLGFDAAVDADRARGPLPPWEPHFRPADCQVRLDRSAVDLGGIGKGLAVRWAARLLERLPPAWRRGFLVEASGDCYCGGGAPEGGPWRVAVEDPRGGTEPRAVLALQDAGCATSSVRVRRWQVGGRVVHHLIDPRTGQPGGAGLLAVTVVGSDTATAEVWSKALFLEGVDGVAALADRRQIAALWVDDQDRLSMSGPMTEYVSWLS